MTSTRHETEVVAPDDLPVVRLVREFDATPARVFRAHVDPDLLVRWFGPADTRTRLDTWDCRSAGSYRYTHVAGPTEMVSYGSFHEVVAPSSIVQTVAVEGMGDGVVLERYRFEELPGGRTRLTVTTLSEDFTTRDQIVASGMEHGVREGHERLDALLADGSVA
ncbi:SRPBCC domain-containing protein [Cellulomonas fimi]|uniref:SRPBCC domain-containing protein n=1 Tax=Cellulomonas fimi TaxID=1708 RepID=UPI002359192C|nr:SRPBCC domain-containing protein [Cellulomonas fimi]